MIPTEKQFNTVKSAYDIANMASRATVLHEKGEQTLVGKCPFCNDKGESLGVSRKQQIYHCFNCRRAGNVMDFYGELYGFRNMNTIIYLMAEEAGIDLVEEEK